MINKFLFCKIYKDHDKYIFIFLRYKKSINILSNFINFKCIIKDRIILKLIIKKKIKKINCIN